MPSGIMGHFEDVGEGRIRLLARLLPDSDAAPGYLPNRDSRKRMATSAPQSPIKRHRHRGACGPARFVSHAFMQRMLERALGQKKRRTVVDGTYGSVAFGIDDDGRAVAIKTSNLGPEMDDDLMYIDTAMNEANAYALLQTHDATCRQILCLRFVCTHRKTVVMAFDSWPWDLHSLFRRDVASELGVTLRDRLHIMLDVARGLQYMHALKPHPMIHGDVKHNNILAKRTTRGWQACIMDLGLAMCLDPEATYLRADHPKDKSSSYMPDDVFMTTAFDVYSMGALLARALLSDFNHYGNRDVVDTLMGQLGRSSVQGGLTAQARAHGLGDDDCTQRLLALVRSCVHKDAVHRPSMRCVCDVLADVLDGR